MYILIGSLCRLFKFLYFLEAMTTYVHVPVEFPLGTRIKPVAPSTAVWSSH